VLVGAGEEPRVVTAHPVKPRDRVGDDRRLRVAEVRDVVDVVDRRRDVERSRHGSASSKVVAAMARVNARATGSM